MDELLQAHTGNDGETRLYEAGYHLLPSIADEAVASEAAKIKDSIAAQNGAIVSEEMPKKTTLAYEIARLIGGKRVFFNSSYFGWVRFEMPQENLALFDRFMKENELVLRYLLLQVKPAEKVSPVARKTPFFSKMTAHNGAKREESVTMAGESKEKDAGVGALSESELDKTIEELIRE
ncbi:MAG: 30S ribosomal protein S6 [Parcubacteria group bacterium]|nr:30S ribosomal protein S6 [Parcubacteria group bacterium]